MKKKLPAPYRVKPTLLQPISLILIVLLLFSSFSCGTGNSDRTKGNGDTTTAQTTLPTSQDRIRSALPALYLERNDFLDLDKSPDHHKIVLQVYQASGSNTLTLALYPAGPQNQHFDDSRIKYPKGFTDHLNITQKQIFLGDQEMNPDDFQKLIKEIKKEPKVKYIIFVPDIKPDNHLFYHISGNDTQTIPAEKALTGSYTSNPSPPKQPS